MLADALFGKGANARMDDGFEFFPRRRISEDGGAQFLPIESSIGLQDFAAERFDNLTPCLASWFDDFACQSVGIDDGGAETLENSCNGRFARGDAAGEPDQFHAILMAKSASACN